ncbi:MAG: TerB family tellurite resistance protein [Leptolyngbya sp. LCM1.Bin17]|nr:MAG: TerB family tellurite resistance protein [Leptolyngbya sp. LCM1.Bin17]
MLTPPSSDCPLLTQMVGGCIRDCCISQAQYQALSALVLADGVVSEQERRQINRLFDAIQTGRVKIVD